MKQITTNTDRYYISTVWLEVLGFWETMVFKRQDNDQIDWSGVDIIRSDKLGTAVFNHFGAIRQALAEEAKPKRKRKHK